MIEKVAAYLAAKKEPASSQELVQNVLKLVNTPVAVANTLMTSVVKNDPQFQQDEQGFWHYRPTPVSVSLWQQPFFLIVAKPERVAHWSLYQRMTLATWDQGHLEIQSVLSNGYLEALAQLSTDLKSRTFVVPGWGNQLSQLGPLLRYRADDRPGLLTSLRVLAGLVFPQVRIVNEDHLAHLLTSPVYGDMDAGVEMQLLADQFSLLLQMLQQQGLSTWAQVHERLQRVRPPVVFDSFVYDDMFIRSLPIDAGVYVMYDRNDKPIYIGKAKNIQERVSSYFQALTQVDEKLAEIRRQLADVRITLTGSELEARLLEFKLIQEWDPPLNRQLRVRERPYRQKNRFPRIVIIPSATLAYASLFFIHPERPLLSVALVRSQQAYPSSVFERVLAFTDCEALAAIVNDYYMVPAATAAVTDPYREIAVSWLSEYATAVESIDMRQVMQANDAVRLVMAYLQSDRVAEPRIFV